MMRIEWRDKALDELEQIYEFIYKQSPKNAENVINQLLDLGNSLGNFPFKFPMEPNYKKENTRFVSKWNYKIVYRVDNERIIVLRVFDTRQNPNKLKG